MKSRLSIAMVAFLAATAIADETMRCGKWVVDREITVPELLEKCGEPTKKDGSTQDVYARNRTDTGTVIVGKTTTERWLYDRGPQSFRMVVTLVDGKIKSVDRDK